MSTGSEASRLLGERIRFARERTGVTQMDLAHLAAVNVANYGKIERGEGNPNFETLIRIAAVLGVDAAELVRGIGADALPVASRPGTVADYLAWKQHH